ncbi:MAG TPA: inorganic phosphate transporter [Leptospiraceae bacterium]|nr:inorganic phosphate transporter [Leptospiraceae bacterium]
MNAVLVFVIIFVVIALAFDYINGFHDAANSIATVVSTRVLTPGRAVLWAAFFNFVAFAIFGTHVAKTIGGDMVNIGLIQDDFAFRKLWVLLCGVIGAIIWNLITWYYGLPSSSSHALIGGYAGAAITANGGFFNGILISAGWIKTVSFIIISPLVGIILGFLIMVAIMWIFRKFSPDRVDRLFRKLQLVSAALFSLGHGGNDAQKTIGIIAAALAASNLVPDAAKNVPFWVVLICYAAIGLGTLSGGWRIVHTMGSRLTKLKPVGGFAAETAGAAAMFMATYGGVPVSTTHTINGSIIGVGATRRLSAVRWGVARSVVWAWILTIPMSGGMAALLFTLVQLGYKLSA